MVLRSIHNECAVLHVRTPITTYLFSLCAVTSFEEVSVAHPQTTLPTKGENSTQNTLKEEEKTGNVRSLRQWRERSLLVKEGRGGNQLMMGHAVRA